MRSRLRAAALLGTLFPASLAAETAREVLDEAMARDRARRPRDVMQIVRMTNVRRGAVLWARELETQTKFYDGDASKTLAFFVSPLDVKGVGFLAWNEPDKTDVQWLYLPKLNRVRQIGPAMRQQSFQETVFSYEDLELFAEMQHWREEDAESRIVDRGPGCDGVPCVLIELVPRRADVSYGRFVIGLHRPDATLRAADLYEKTDGSLRKTARFSDFTEVDGIPVARKTHLADVKIGLETRIEVVDTRFNQGFDEEMFTPWYMERVVK